MNHSITKLNNRGTWHYSAFFTLVGLILIISSVFAQSQGLLSHWTLDENTGSVASDTQNNQDGALQNGVSWSSSCIDTFCLSFDGSDDYVDLGSSSSLTITGPLTLAGWAYVNTNAALSTHRTLISRGSVASSAGNEIYYLAASFNGWQCHISNGTSKLVAVSGNSVSDDVWQHVACTWDGTILKLYKDGNEIASATDTNFGDIHQLQGSNQNTAIGGDNRNNRFYWDGRIDDLRIYTTALSASEINQLASPGPSGPVCGNSVVESGEACDGNSQACTDAQGYTGTQSCSGSCTWNSCVSTESCGDNICNGLENCGSCLSDCSCSGGQQCQNNQCINPAPSGNCGNNICEPLLGENCGSCLSDCACQSGETCSNNQCVTQNLGQTYYLDISNGNNNNPGTSSQPWQTLSYALSQLQDGETVLVRNGNYGELQDSTTRSDWVTVKADVGHHPIVSGINVSGNVHLIVDGFNATDGFNRFRVWDSAYNFVLNNSIIQRINGSHHCMQFRNSENLTVANSELTDCNRGILFTDSKNLNILNNHIHHLYTDAINVPGSQNVLIEGNDIHHIDWLLPGTWVNLSCLPSTCAPHNDGIQTWSTGIDPKNIVVRNNKVHQIRHQCMLYNGVGSGDITLESNLFYNCAGTTLQAGGNSADNNTLKLIGNTFLGVVLIRAGTTALEVRDNIIGPDIYGDPTYQNGQGTFHFLSDGNGVGMLGGPMNNNLFGNYCPWSCGSNFPALNGYNNPPASSANNVQIVPQFTDPNNGDYTPLTGSIACNMSSLGSYVGALPCAGQTPVNTQCGNNVCEIGEHCANCVSDCGCQLGESCSNNQCVMQNCQNGQSQSCYTGLLGTENVGICTNGTETCSNNQWESCVGEVTPQTETCNGLDDDCDGSVDEYVCSCASLGGSVCQSGEICTGMNLIANDTNFCCSTSCGLPQHQLCSECGNGLFNFICDRNECNSIPEGCFYTSGFLGVFGNSCNVCSGTTSCEDYGDDQTTCNNNPCSVQRSCVFQNNQCSTQIMLGPICGNGVIEGNEACDNGNNNGNVCAPAYNMSCSYCDTNCQNIVNVGAYCGDGICNGPETIHNCANDCLGSCQAQNGSICGVGESCPGGNTILANDTLSCCSVACQNSNQSIQAGNLCPGGLNSAVGMQGIPIPHFGMFNTNIMNFTNTNLTGVPNFMLSTNHASIQFLHPVNMLYQHFDPTNITTTCSPINFSHIATFNQQHINLDPSVHQGLNQPAQITFFNVSLTNPEILRDGTVCPTSICTNITQNGTAFSFYVTGFSTYTLQEGEQSSEQGGSSSGGGGGGSGSSSRTQSTTVQLFRGQEEVHKISVRRNAKIALSLDGSPPYNLWVEDISKETVRIRLSGIAEKHTISRGQTQNLDLEGDGEEDIYITLESVYAGGAELSIHSILEKQEVKTQTIEEGPRQYTDARDTQTVIPTEIIRIDDSRHWFWQVILIVVLLLTLFIIAHVYIKKHLEEKHKKRET